MTAKLKIVLNVGVLCALVGCRHQDPVVTLAKSDFRKTRPNVEIVESGVRKRDADQTIVYVQFVSTPATALPQKAGIWEDEMVYKSEGGKWQCISIKGGTYYRCTVTR